VIPENTGFGRIELWGSFAGDSWSPGREQIWTAARGHQSFFDDRFGRIGDYAQPACHSLLYISIESLSYKRQPQEQTERREYQPVNDILLFLSLFYLF